MLHSELTLFIYHLLPDSEQLRDELGDVWLKWKQEEAKVQTLKINNRYYKTLIQNLEREVNKYAGDITNRIHYQQLLQERINGLTSERNRYHDQVTALENDKLILQDNLDKARNVPSLENNLLPQDKVSCYIV